MQAGVLSANIRRTIQATIASRCGVGSLASRIFFYDALSDPGELDESTSALVYWCEVRFLGRGTDGVGILVQVDFYWEVGDKGDQATRDRYGFKVQQLADDFVNNLAGAANDRGIFVNDYTDPSNPVATTRWVICVNGRGFFGMPDDRAVMFDNRGYVREVLTFKFKHDTDLAPVPHYFP